MDDSYARLVVAGGVYSTHAGTWVVMEADATSLTMADAFAPSQQHRTFGQSTAHAWERMQAIIDGGRFPYRRMRAHEMVRNW